MAEAGRAGSVATITYDFAARKRSYELPAETFELKAHIGDYIAADNPDRAVSFVRELRQRCETLADMPLAHPMREEFSKGIRLLVHHPYLILYRVLSDEVQIERVRHGARKVIDLLRSSDDP